MIALNPEDVQMGMVGRGGEWCYNKLEKIR
jgi:hypothetical protein